MKPQRKHQLKIKEVLLPKMTNNPNLHTHLIYNLRQKPADAIPLTIDADLMNFRHNKKLRQPKTLTLTKSWTEIAPIQVLSLVLPALVTNNYLPSRAKEQDPFLTRILWELKQIDLATAKNPS